MNSTTLLAELALLTHDQRVQRMIALGRSAARDRQAAAILARFEAGNFYERYFALVACAGSRDGAHALRVLNDASQQIRGFATRLIAELCDDGQVRQALLAVPMNLRMMLLWRLRKRKRQGPIDAFLDDLAANGDEQFGRLLFLGSADAVERHIVQVEDALGAADWKRLARQHPDLTQQRLQRRAAATTRLDNRLVFVANAALPDLADKRPDAALVLVETLRQHVGLHQLDLAQLVLRRPAAMADIVLASADQIRTSFDRVAHRLDTERLLALLQRRRGLVTYHQLWFRRLSPAQRSAVYAVAERGWRDREGVLAHWLVMLLPGATRYVEARRHLALPALQTRPAQRLLYAALLPWEEAYRVLERFIRNPDPELRVAAQTALALCARFNRERLPDLLATIRARKNEQDPVRLAMMTGLSELPPARWQSAHLDDLAQIIRDALNAADLSNTTARAIEQLIFALLPFHTAWSAQWLATLVQSRGQLSFTSLESHVNAAQVRQIAPLLLPVLRAWANREREYQLVTVAQCFGRRIESFPELSDLIERILNDTRIGWVAAAVLGVIAAHRRDRLAELVPQLLSADKSWIMQPIVYTYLHRRRQDLITPFLGQNAYGGRFSSGVTRIVLPLDSGFHRWTPAQQQQFARTLEELTRDSERDMPGVFRAIHQLSRLPAVPPTRIIQLADKHMENLAVRDYAVRALGRLDGANGVQPLLDCMDDDRARIAIYALRRTLLRMPSDRALELLRAVPLVRVTVAKEVVRLIGDLHTEAGYRELLAMSGQALHRDIRVALLRALWEHIERAETWSLLEAAAVDEDSAVAAGVAYIPADRISTQARQRLAQLLATLLSHPDPEVRVNTLQRCATLPIEDGEQQMLTPLTFALGSALPDERTAAAGAVFATYVGQNATAVGAAVRAIRPERRALLDAVQALQSAALQQRERLLPTVRAVLTALADDRLTTQPQITLAMAALPWEELPPLIEQLASTGQFHADMLQSAKDMLPQAARRTDADELEAFEASLTASDNAHLRRLGLAVLVAQANDVHGWSDERVERLEHFRTDDALLVAAAAQFTFVRGE